MSKYDCPICGQYMDYIAITYRNHPYIDGQTYKRMCFGCAQTPVEFVQIYGEDDSLESEEGPFFDYKHICTPEELYDMRAVNSLEEAKKCVRGVKKKIQEAGAVSLRKLKLKRPKQEYELNPEQEEREAKQWDRQRAKKKRT